MTRQQIMDAYEAMSRIDVNLIAAAERETGFLSYVEDKQPTKKERRTMSAGALAACIAGFIGTNIDSLIGAVFENRKVFGNAGTNLLATLFGGLAAAGIFLLLNLL